MPQPLRHAILGAGGVGGLVGACLARGRCSRHYGGQSGIAAARYPEQLQLESTFRKFHGAGFPQREVPVVDVLWITVKATQLEESLGAITAPAGVRERDRSAAERHRSPQSAAGAISAGTKSFQPQSRLKRSELPRGTFVHRSPFARLNVHSSGGQDLLSSTLDTFAEDGIRVPLRGRRSLR